MREKYHQRCAGLKWKIAAPGTSSSFGMGASIVASSGMLSTTNMVFVLPSSARTLRASHTASGVSCGGSEKARQKLEAMKREYPEPSGNVRS